MEASKRPTPDGLSQLPFEERPSVRAIGDRIVVESLTVNDARAAKVVRERAEAGTTPSETVAKAVEIGTRVIDSESTATNVDYVQRVFEDRVGKLGEVLGETLEEGSAEIAKHIAETFDVGRSDSVQGEIKQMLVTAAEHQRRELHKMLIAEDSSNPLVAVQLRTTKQLLEAEDRHRKEVAALRESGAKESRALQARVAELVERFSRHLERGEAEELLAEAEEAGTRKGRSFEERVHAALETMADGFGDAAHHTGDERGDGGTKKGDTVIEVGAAHGPCRARIVFEDKTEKLSKNKAWDELNGAMSERQADFGVLVVSGTEKMPSGREELVEYEGNKLIVAVEPDEPDCLALKLAYRYVRVRLLMARDASLEVDASGVRDAAEAAGAALKRVNGVKQALTHIDNSSKKARDGLEGIIGDVEVELGRIESLVAETTD
ncbi:MAG: hypothetical protein ABIZ50_04575 [Solirubrobacterales bacterium]